MPDKDFEKQVKKKMDELHFIPSELVWHKVEEQIAEPDKRKRLLIWLPLLLLLITGATWYYKSKHTTHESPDPVAAAAATNDPKQEVITGETSALEKNRPIKNDHAKPGKNELGLKPANTPGTDKNFVKQAGKPVNHKVIVYTHLGTPVRPGNERINTNATLQEAADKEKARQIINKNNIETIAEAGVKTVDHNTNDKEDTLTTIAIVSAITGVTGASANRQVVPEKESKTDSSTVAAKTEKSAVKKTNIEWGIIADGGISGISQGFSGFLQSSSAIPTVNYYNNTPAAPATVAGSPSEIKPGAAYSIGLSGHRKYGSSFLLFAGINYSYYSTRINVGQKTDSTALINQGGLGLQSVNSFYRNSNINSHNYTNHFHYIELPIGIEKQLGRGSRFSLHTGFTVSRFISSNALHYDSQKNIYYEDNKLINKTQLGFFGGLSYRFGQNNTSMEIGPQLHYGITNLYKKELYGNRHLIVVAVSARWFFHKNKH